MREAARESAVVPAGRDDLYETIVENLFDGVYYVDRERTIVSWNPASERITGYSANEVVGRRCYDNILGHVNDRGEPLCLTRCPLVEAMAQRRGIEAEVFLRHLDGHRLPVHVRCQPVRARDGSVVGAVEVFSEDRPYRRAMHRIGDLERLSGTDELTGLPNRRAAELSLRSRLRDLRDGGWPLGLLFVDIDDFKRFNDLYGHEIGDRVLRVASRSLQGTLRESDVAARWGGEEFVVITAAADRVQVEALADRVRGIVEASSPTIEGTTCRLTVSVGATLATVADTPRTLVERADRAMYRGKKAGRNRIAFLGLPGEREQTVCSRSG